MHLITTKICIDDLKIQKQYVKLPNVCNRKASFGGGLNDDSE